MAIATSFIWIIIFFDGAFEYGTGAKFEIMLEQTPNCSVYNSVKCHNFIYYLTYY
jgi:hypothetical protein